MAIKQSETLIYTGLNNTFCFATMFKMSNQGQDVYLLLNDAAPTVTSTVHAAETIFELLKTRRDGSTNFRLLHMFKDGSANVAESIHDGESQTHVMRATTQVISGTSSNESLCDFFEQKEVIQTPNVRWLHFNNVYDLLELEEGSLPLTEATACL